MYNTLDFGRKVPVEVSRPIYRVLVERTLNIRVIWRENVMDHEHTIRTTDALVVPQVAKHLVVGVVSINEHESTVSYGLIWKSTESVV